MYDLHPNVLNNIYEMFSLQTRGVETMGAKGAQAPNILTGGLAPVILNLSTC